jgi:hypothetical protein
MQASMPHCQEEPPVLIVQQGRIQIIQGLKSVTHAPEQIQLQQLCVIIQPTRHPQATPCYDNKVLRSAGLKQIPSCDKHKNMLLVTEGTGAFAALTIILHIFFAVFL